MLFSSLALSLAAMALAAPAPMQARDDSSPPPTSEEFTVAFSVGYSDSRYYLAAEATTNYTDSGYAPQVVLVGRPIVSSIGTPAYMNGTDPRNAALVFDLRNQTNNASALYGAFAAELGEAYGASANVDLVEGQQEMEWIFNNGSIDHQRDAAPQSLFSCNSTVNGEAVSVLQFGVTQENLEPPVGCQFTSVIQRFNLS